ncbi:hypothetical protein K493DRAFT_342027 [Basidiobolus meristosporus CBS 931.73]|uniref:Uncharacterized protein n=1 Tax=Basidiobolus meristosporus CBS 931.73 TaxID=1314790 RepID=A0A1Y1XCL7_9FUNG|nr:hypothetical protein K493DRAFT_342027 [Basidiobolus meristosporus CBS 931.73]|eukprot:ORX83457.1 hypothetical protein K493DRAFT_342027 [Basidiobolus meristosporus CBS 931.73]
MGGLSLVLLGGIWATACYLAKASPHYKSKPVVGISFGYDIITSPEPYEAAALWDGLDAIPYTLDSFIDGDLSGYEWDNLADRGLDALTPLRPVQPLHPPEFGNAPMVIPDPVRQGFPSPLKTKVDRVETLGTPSVVKVHRPAIHVETPKHPDRQPWMSFTTDSERYRIETSSEE